MRLSRWVGLALFGAVVCTYGDHLHATHGVLVYRRPFLFEQAWWVPLLFFCATLLTTFGARPFVRGTTSPRRLLADFIGFASAYAFTSFLPWDRPNTTLAVLVVVFLVRILGEARPRGLVIHCLILGVVGSLWEGALSSTGCFHYLHPDFALVPRWLPGIYLHAGLISGELYLWMTAAGGQSSSKTDSA